jgi:hypothetical protein
MVRQLSEVMHLALFPDVEPWPPAREVIDCDLIMRLYDEFGISVSDDTIYRPKKTSPCVWRKSARSLRRAHRGGVVPGRDTGRAEEQADLPLGAPVFRWGAFSGSVACVFSWADLPWLQYRCPVIARIAPRPSSACLPERSANGTRRKAPRNIDNIALWQIGHPAE